MAVLRWTLVVLSMAMLMGHICVLPANDHPEAAPTHADAGHPHDSDEAMHAESCEALPSSPVACPAVLTISAFRTAALTESPAGRVGDAGLSPSLKLPPLFLLHASLLI